MDKLKALKLELDKQIILFARAWANEEYSKLIDLSTEISGISHKINQEIGKGQK